MKLYAFVRRDDGDHLIHVWDAERTRQEKPDDEHERYYSTELDASQRSEMVLVHRDGLMFFRYKQLPPEGAASTGQSLTHLKVKEFLCRMGHIRLLLPEGMLELWINKWQPEHRIELEDGSVVIADMAGHLAAGYPPQRIKRWPEDILFEVTVTHPTEPEKLEALERLEWTVIELPIVNSLRIPEGLGVSQERILAGEAALEEQLRKGIPARILTEPGGRNKSGDGLLKRFMRIIDEIITN